MKLESVVSNGIRVDIGITALVILIQTLAILHPEAIPFDSEELYNAAHARLVQLCHVTRWLDLQYRGYCGGCSLNAGLGAAFFALFGPSIAAWKLVPIAYMATMCFVGSRLLRTHVNTPAATAWCLLLCFLPPTFLELSLTAWGNHYESGVLAIVTLYATIQYLNEPSTKRAATIGLLLAVGLWIGLSSTFVVFGVSLAVARRIQLRHLLALMVGLTPLAMMWLIQLLTAASPPFETIYYAGEHVPRLARFPAKMWSLLAPRQLVALFGFSDHWLGWMGGWASALAMTVGAVQVWKNPRVRPASWFLLAFLVVYGLVRFTVWTPPAPEIAPPGSMRYAAPLYGLLLLMLSAAAGMFWSQNRRILVVSLLAPSILVGLHARAKHLSGPFPDASVFQMAAPDFEYARDQASYLIPFSEHLACDTPDVQVNAFRDFSIGWHETRSALDADPLSMASQPSRTSIEAWEGVAAALMSEIDADEQGGMRSLMFLEQRIINLDDETKTLIHAEAAWRRNWDAGLAEHGPERLREWNLRIQMLPASAQRGATMAFGRQWARDRTRWRQPKATAFPDLSTLDANLHEAFAQGFGVGIGERWGPNADAIAAVPQPLITAWNVGLRRGKDKRWIRQTR